MKKTLTIIAALSTAASVFAQNSNNACGGEATGSGGSSSYSVGQIATTTNDGSSGTISQGIQHAYEIYSVGIKEPRLDIALTAFPNPTSDYLTVQINSSDQEVFSYQLHDLNGKLLKQGPIAGTQTRINMNSLPIASYFVKIVNQENNEVQTFKIVKK